MLKTLVAGLALSALAAGHAASQDYPNRPITMIVPFAAGGASDIIARLVGEEMGKALGQRIINENVGGAGGSTALARVARATPDGYTIVIGNSGTNAATYHIHQNLPFRPEDFVGVGLVAKTSPVIALKKDFPASTVAELIAFGRANPGRLTIGHAGVGSSNYLICKSFLQAAGIQAQLVGYRGAGPAQQDVISGNIDAVCDNATAVAQAIATGQIKGLVVSSPTRLKSLPQVPTAQEAGIPGFQAQGWNGIFVPRGTPAAVIARLEQAVKAAVGSEIVQRRFGELETQLPDPEETTPAFMADFVPREIAKFGALLKP